MKKENVIKSEEEKQKKKCKKCIWKKVIADDKYNNYYEVFCMFPKCIRKDNK